MRGSWWLVVALASCGDDGSAAKVDAPTGTDAPSPDACVPAGASSRVIYLSRAGGAYTGGPDDSRTNTTQILNGAKTIPAPTVVAGEWTSFVTCVQSKLAPFAVTVTDVDPGTMPHMELVAIDSSQTIGFPASIFGLAPQACDGMDGKVFDNGVAFVAWNVGAAERCATGAQMIGNLFGLDHAFSCPDLMTFLTGCGPSEAKTFTNMDVPCGESAARTCSCGKSTQNAARTLARVAGTTCP